MSLITQGFFNNRIAAIGFSARDLGVSRGMGPRIIRDELVAYYDATNPKSYSGSGNTVYDLSGNGRTGTLTNGVAFSSNNRGYFIFDGSNDYIDCSTIPSTFWVDNSWSAAFWIKFDGINIGVDQGICGTNGQVHFLQRSTTFYLGLWGNDSASVTVPVANVWYHVVFCYNNLNYQQKIFVNGVIDRTANGGKSSVSGAGTAIGRVPFGYGYFKGQIATAQFYNRNLSDNEVRSLYLSTAQKYTKKSQPYVTDGLIYHLDASNPTSYSGSGSTIWSDLSTSYAHGKLYSGAAFTSENGGGITFDGTDDYFTTDSATAFNGLTKMSAEITFKLTGSISGYKHIINKPQSVNGGTWALYPQTFTNKLTWYLNADSSTFSFSDVVVNKTYHYAMTYDLVSLKTFVNGTLISSVPYTTALSYDNTKPVNIGRFDTTGYLGPAVNVYNVKVYSRALTSTEIKQNYLAIQNSFNPDIVRKGLVLLLDAADKNSYPGKGTKWYDLSGNQNHARMVTYGTSYPVFQNNGFYFNGNTSKAAFVCANSRNLANKKELSVFVWCKTIDGTGRQYAVDTRGAGSVGAGAGIGFDKPSAYKTFTFVDSVAGYDESSAPTTFQNNTVYQLGVSKSYAGTAISILDTDSVTKISPSLANNTLTSADINLGPYTIGVYSGGLSSQDNYWWKGEIYLVMMYDRELSQAEITQNFNALRGRFGL
ncbi:MAG: Aureococcus anophagefferens virus [Bacteroidota bacterium]|jgi:hypothetical protein